ncbi:MAG TPA: signal peptide peptidase SppA [Phycisphaerae bacterium]|nr:signal peptide peptidase SppA [Phycisphaerae bacterium]
MKQFRYLLILSLAFSPLAAEPAAAGEDDVVAVFEIKGDVPEAPDSSGLGELFGEQAPTTMFDLLEKLRAARTDENVQAVVFEIENAALGFAQIQELRAQFEALKAAEKDVWVFAETLHSGSLALGSAASHLVLLPTGEVDFRGLYGEASYFKNMLDKIGVEADILHCGDYKSAGEPFYRTGPSKEADEQTNRLLDGIFEELIASVAKSRRLDPKRVRELIDIGAFSAKEALEAKLVDKLAYREEFVKTIKKRYGADVKITHKYGKKKGPEVDFENPFAFFKLFSDLMKGPEESDKPAIAVVYVEGPITTGKTESGLFGGSSNAGSTTVRKAIAKAAADDNVKALILRVDSPGGSAIASDIICEATKRFKKSGRPFVVSMGNVAGSGGYYVATLGDTIFAEPSTITGSIGVVGGKLVTKGLWDWVGITGHEYKRGKHADIMNTNRKFSEEERAKISEMMNRVYEEFKGRVVEGRSDHIKGELESLAGGRVYTGKQALEIGLVDRLGGFADAIKYTANEAELGNDYELKVFPKPKNIMDIFAEAFGGKEDKEDFVSLRTAGMQIGAKFAGLPGIAAGVEALNKLDPQKARAMKNFLIQMELLSNEGVLLVGPPCMEMMP